MTDAISIVMKFVLDRMAKELVNQGHKVTGELIASLYKNSRVIEQGDNIIIQGVFESYGIQMDIGRRPGKFVPIAALIKWVQDKAIATGDVEVKRVAWAINWTIMREGVPTRGSRSMGKKTGWMSDTLVDIEKDLRTMIFKGADQEIRNSITEMIKRV